MRSDDLILIQLSLNSIYPLNHFFAWIFVLFIQLYLFAFDDSLIFINEICYETLLHAIIVRQFGFRIGIV